MTWMRSPIVRALGMSLALSLASGCSLRSHAARPAWPIAPCPAETLTLPDPPIRVQVQVEGEAAPRAATALTDDSWAVLLPWLAAWRACALERGRTLEAVNGRR